MTDSANNSIREYINALNIEASGFINNLLQRLSEGLDASKTIVNNTIDAVDENISAGSEWLKELASYYHQSLQNLANSLAYLLNGGTLPLDMVKHCSLPPGVSFPGMMLPGFIPPGACGPDIGGAEKTFSPIILDLDGDGVETRSLQDGIYFDHDGNQFAENTGWVGADDGLLVLDKDGNGVIETGNELFGNNTRLKDGTLAANGYQALQDLDSNQDGVLNAEDAAWAQLKIWRDRNGNARTDDGELLTMEEANIAAIDTHYKKSSFVDEQGNSHKQTGNITMTDGSIRAAADVWFATNPGNTRYTVDVDISRSVRALPYIRGFGNMANLHVAMSQNTQLREMIEQYIADPQRADDLLQNIIFTWAGVTEIATDSRGSYIDARRLAVLESATGDNYQNVTNGTVDPLNNAAAVLKDEYRRFAAYVEASLLSQTIYREDFTHIGLQIKADLSGMTLNFATFENHLEELKKTDFARYLQVRNIFYNQLEYLPDFAQARSRIGIADNLLFMGNDENNVLKGAKTNDYLWGGAGNDTLSGSGGNDLLAGGAGNDTLNGGYGSDIYVFNAGDGQDIIEEDNSYDSDIDTLRFGEGLRAEDAILRRSGGDLLISFRNSSDSVTLDDYFFSESNRYRVEQIAFADGTVWDVAAVKAMLIVGTDKAQTLTAYAHGSEIHASGGDDTVKGGKGADQLYGDDGNDKLTGDGGNDLLAGGAGNDTLNGGYGSDTYLFNAGDGQDIIEENNSSDSDIDTLHFGAGLLAKDAVLRRSGSDLMIGFRHSSDSVTLDNYFFSESNRYRVEQIAFADGTVWDVATVKAMLIVGTDDAQTLSAFSYGSEIHAGGGDDIVKGGDGEDRLYGDDGNDTLTGGSSNDELYGGAGDDILDGGTWNDLLAGGSGNDTLKGGTGSDTYLFNAGDGQDTIVEGSSNSGNSDTLRFGDGLLAKDALVQRSGNDLIIGFRNNSDSVTVTRYFSSAKYQVETISFADGTDWLPEDIQSHIEHDIPLPLASSVETSDSLQRVRQQMAGFLAGDDGDDEGVGDVIPQLNTSRSSVSSLMNA
ncbi:calcium-binding protein [Klebsiella sp. RHBSTW-00484]|uniref:calcium-binding protein n=1 Tax=Klebsiella sp. RHBSTW-00484 TaxID=2742651 RepID=UPI002E0ED9B5